MMADTSDVDIVHLPDCTRFEVRVDDQRAGWLEYELADGVMTFTHTVTNPEMRGKGLAAIVVRHGLDHARSNHCRVVPQCWYVAQFIERHAAYADLVKAPD